MNAIWDRVLPVAVAVAVVEGLVVGYVFSAFSGAGFLPEYGAALAVIVGVTVLVGAVVVERIARQRLTGPAAAHLALIDRIAPRPCRRLSVAADWWTGLISPRSARTGCPPRGTGSRVRDGAGAMTG